MSQVIDDQLRVLLSPYQASDWSLSHDQASDWLIQIYAHSNCHFKSYHFMHVCESVSTHHLVPGTNFEIEGIAVQWD